MILELQGRKVFIPTPAIVLACGFKDSEDVTRVAKQNTTSVPFMKMHDVEEFLYKKYCC